MNRRNIIAENNDSSAQDIDDVLLYHYYNDGIKKLIFIANLIWNNTPPIDKDKTINIFKQTIRDGLLDKLDKLNEYHNNLLKIRDILYNIHTQYLKPRENNPIIKSAIRNFVKSKWYDMIATLQVDNFQQDITNFLKNINTQQNYYADSSTVIQQYIRMLSRTSFQLLNRTGNAAAPENINFMRSKISKIYEAGINDEKTNSDKQMGIDKIVKFLQIIKDIELFFNSRHFQHDKIYILAPKTYTELMQQICDGLEFYSSIDVDKTLQLFNQLKSQIFTELKNVIPSDTEYSDDVFNDANNIKYINEQPVHIKPADILKFNANQLYRYYGKDNNDGSDVLKILNDRIAEKDITANEASVIISNLNLIATQLAKLKMGLINTTPENEEKANNFDKKIFLYARTLALNEPAQLNIEDNDDTILNSITTLSKLNDALKNGNSLYKYRKNLVGNLYKDLVDNINDIESKNFDQTFNKIYEYITLQQLDSFFDLNGDNSLIKIFETLQKSIDKHNKNDKHKTKISIKSICTSIEKFLKRLYYLKHNEGIIQRNIDTYKKQHNNEEPYMGLTI